MERKDRIDAFGAALLIWFSFLMGVNQVLVKLVNEGFSPVFQAGLRSACALVPVLAFALITRKRLSITDGSLIPGIVCGLLFSFEFVLLFTAFEYTAVSRASVLFYTMPVWVAVAAHWLFPGERLTPRRMLGLAMAVGGVAWALLDSPGSAEGSLIGDVMCIIGAMFWAGIAIVARSTPLSKSTPEMQLLYQLAVSAPVLLLVAPLFGDMIREVTPTIIGIFSFQVLVRSLRISDMVLGFADLSGVRHDGIQFPGTPVWRPGGLADPGRRDHYFGHRRPDPGRCRDRVDQLAPKAPALTAYSTRWN